MINYFKTAKKIVNYYEKICAVEAELLLLQ